jgi:hypothetical protein
MVAGGGHEAGDVERFARHQQLASAPPPGRRRSVGVDRAPRRHVGLTRARRHLEVLHAVYGQRGMYELSRFLAEPEVMASFTQVDGTADPTADAEPATGSAACPAVDAASLLAQLRGEDLE